MASPGLSTVDLLDNLEQVTIGRRACGTCSCSCKQSLPALCGALTPQPDSVRRCNTAMPFQVPPRGFRIDSGVSKRKNLIASQTLDPMTTGVGPLLASFTNTCNVVAAYTDHLTESCQLRAPEFRTRVPHHGGAGRASCCLVCLNMQLASHCCRLLES